MKDKVQKIREEVERLKSQLLRGACSSQIAMETRCKEEAYNEVLAILDTMQEQHKETNFLDELKTKLDSMSKEEFEQVWEKYRVEEKEEPIILTEEMLKKNGFLLNPRPRYNPPYWSKLFTASDGREYLCKINMEQKIRETLMTIMPLASNDGVGQPTCYLPHPKTVQQLQDSLRLFNIKDIIEV
jgi:hypothetical protein